MYNRLASEKSPYLLQHAHNPVDWYPWGEEAFAKAKAEDKPLLVSIGYSTCHWCHVMERESFENPAIAEIMNRNLVCVKVDREERPDVDRLYMTAVQALTGQGGWPLNVFLSPDGKPFLGGTYFPPEDRWGRAGWPQVVERIGQAWRDPEARGKFLAQGEGLTRALAEMLEGKAEETTATILETADLCGDALRGAFDAEQGGFSPAPKFPMPVNQDFLFRQWAFSGRPPARDNPLRQGADQALFTLAAMAKGGIFDHVGGGFHRYSTDARWHLPHFEKMLYDNAQLAANYLDAFRITGDAAHAATARQTLEYILGGLRHPDGAFYSAEDADSLPAAEAKEKKEGAFYVWTAAELEAILGAEAALFMEAYGVEKTGNVLEDPQGEFGGANVLFRALDDDGLAARHGGAPEEAARRLAAARTLLFQARAKRPRPHLDDKVLTAWNGLAISAFAQAEGLLEGAWAAAATQAAEFLRVNLWDAGTNRLYRRWRDGQRDVPGMADDHAFLAEGLLDLYEAGFDVQWLLWAERLADILMKDFIEDGAVYTTVANHDPRLILRAKEEGDNVEPSAASVAVRVFLRLSRMRGRGDLEQAAQKILAGQLGRAAAHPRGFPRFIAAALMAQAPPQEVVLAGPRDQAWGKLWKEVRRRFLPFSTVLWADQGKGQEVLGERLAHLKGLRTGEAVAMLCRDGRCQRPERDPGRWGALLP